MKFGVYFYPWYNEQKWLEAPTPYVPVKGRYDSRDPGVIDWQAELIRECGFDYVVIEFVPLGDWCFESSVTAIELMIEALRSRSLQWSFLIDGDVLPRSLGRIHELAAMVRYVEQRGWTDGLIIGPSSRRLMFSYAPTPEEAAWLSRTFPHFEWRFPLYLQHWGRPDSWFDLPTNRIFAEDAREQSVTVFDALVPKGYICFWEDTLVTANFRGFSSVMPGYSDLLLSRSLQLAPEVARRKGETFTGQFRNAVQGGAEHILVYSWNEYFEGTNLEPATEYGHEYTELAGKLISEARSGERCPR
jgi:hypothetical protein